MDLVFLLFLFFFAFQSQIYFKNSQLEEIKEDLDQV